MKRLSLLVLLSALAAPLHAQTIDDGIMMGVHSLQAGNFYTRDTWDQYWEGTLKRTNGNIGTITTQTDTWSAVYGVTDRLSVMGSVPRVWTNPSAGVLAGQRGMQDITLAGKFSFYEHSSEKYGRLRAIAAVSGSFPISDYTPDFAPLSIGTQSQRISPRLTLYYRANVGVYLNGTTSYTRRADVTIDRPYFFTDDQITFSNQVPMPNVSDYTVSVGYLKHELNANVSYSEQTTQGGGDTRRQDMPFVSNRQNFSRVGAMAMYTLPKIKDIAVQFEVAHILDGRNVGQSTSYTFGVLYCRAYRGRLTR
jgi:hypothetical protein